MGTSEAPTEREGGKGPAGKQRSRLVERGFSMIMPSNIDQMLHAEDKHGEDSWQVRVMHKLHSKTIQRTLIALLLLDVLILFVELFLLATFPSCSIVKKEAISCCPATVEQLSGGGGEEEEICEPGLEVTGYPAGCDLAHLSTVHTAEVVLFSLTIAILSLFMIELLLQMAAMTPCVFFRNGMYGIDFIIISVSLVLEITFFTLEEDAFSSLLGLLILGRVWRFIRISHGLVEVTHEVSAERYGKLLAYAELLEDAFTAKGMELPEGDFLQRLHGSTDSKELAEMERHERVEHLRRKLEQQKEQPDPTGVNVDG